MNYLFDTNILMYLVGAPHLNRERAAVLPRNRPGGLCVTSTEVYQEILHRYTSINRRAAAKDAFRLLDDLVASVFPITQADVHAARKIAEEHVLLSARDCLHLAEMRAKGVERALTYDQGFSAFPGISILP